MSRLWVRIPQTPDSPKTFFYFFLNFFLFNYVTVLFRYYHTPKKTICRWKLRPNCKGQFMRVWYLLHMRTAKGEMSLHIRAISPQPLLFVLKKKRSRWRFSPNFVLFKAVVLLLWIHYLMFPHWVVRAPCLVLVLLCFTECSFLFCNHLVEEERSWFLAFTVFLRLVFCVCSSWFHGLVWDV